jgi:hypothetical protein
MRVGKQPSKQRSMKDQKFQYIFSRELKGRISYING